MRYRYDDIVRALRESGIEEGDTVFFTTSLGMVGIPPPEVTNQEDLNRLFFQAMKEAVGAKGTILVPTYSYTFGKSRTTNLAIFDPQTTPAEIGPFPNFFLRQEGVRRNLDPMVSVAGLGPKSQELLEGNLPTSYGEGSFFSKLVRSNAKCCSIGLGPNWTPFIHYADWVYKVPFRFDKLFVGLIKEGEEIKKRVWLYSVRILADESYPDAHRAGREAEEAGIWRFSKLGRARVYSARIRDYFEFVCAKLQSNRWYLARGPARDVLEIERKRVGVGCFEAFGPFDPIRWRLQMSKIRIDTVSEGFTHIIQQIQNYFGGTIGKKRSGEWVGDFVVPEQWTLKRAALIDLESGEDLLTNPLIRVRSYSLPFSGEVDDTTLQAHTNIPNDLPPFVDRDWGFESFQPITGRRFKVEIESNFSLGELCYLDLDGPGDIIVCYIKESTLQVVVDLLATKTNQRIVLVSSYVGFLCWLEKNPNTNKPIHHLGIEGEYFKGGNPILAGK
ncbi:MAG: AAC(3) family N-acetyltransferase [Campylobacterales bacterium]